MNCFLHYLFVPTYFQFENFYRLILIFYFITTIFINLFFLFYFFYILNLYFIYLYKLVFYKSKNNHLNSKVVAHFYFYRTSSKYGCLMHSSAVGRKSWSYCIIFDSKSSASGVAKCLFVSFTKVDNLTDLCCPSILYNAVYRLILYLFKYEYNYSVPKTFVIC